MPTRVVKQAEFSKANAEANINRKLNVLESWLSEGIPFRRSDDGNILLDEKDGKILEYYPKSLRQFKAWDGTQNSNTLRNTLPELSKTGNDTLAKRPALEEKVGKLVAALRLRAESQKGADKHSAFKRLEEELCIAEETIKIRNLELREQQRQLQQIRRSHEILLKKAEGDAAEFERERQSLLTELKTQMSKNSELVAQLAKVLPINGRTVPDKSF